MPISDASLLNCKLVEHLDASPPAQERLVGGSRYVRIWKDYLAVLSGYSRGGSFIAHMIEFLRKAYPDVDLEPVGADPSADDFVRIVDVLRRSDSRAREEQQDPLEEVLYWYYIAQTCYLLRRTDNVLDCVAECLEWIGRAESQATAREALTALYYYRYLLATLLLDISRNKVLEHPRRFQTLEKLASKTTEPFLLALSDQIFGEHKEVYDFDLKEYLRFALSLYPSNLRIDSTPKTSFERYYAASGSHRVAVEQFHGGRFGVALETLERVLKLAAGDDEYLKWYSARARYYRGLIRIKLGMYGEADADLSEGENYFLRIGDTFASLLCRIHRTEILVRRYRFAEAQQQLVELTQECEDRGYDHELGLACLLRGRAHTQMHHQAAAEIDFDQAAQVFQATEAIVNTLDLLYWQAVTRCRWHRQNGWDRKINEARGYLEALWLAEQNFGMTDARLQLLPRPTRLERQELIELHVALAARDLPAAEEQCRAIVDQLSEQRASSRLRDQMLAAREKIAVALTGIQLGERFSGVDPANLPSPGRGPKARARRELAELLCACARIGRSDTADHVTAITRRAEQVWSSTCSAGLRSGIANLLDEFSYYFVSRAEFLGLVLILAHEVQRWERRSDQQLQWVAPFLQEVSTYLNEERLRRLENCTFEELEDADGRSALGRQLLKWGDTETFRTHYESYVRGLAGLKFHEPMLGRVQDPERPTLQFFVRSKDGSIEPEVMEDFRLTLLEDAHCAVEGMGIVVQYQEQEEKGDFKVYPIADVSSQELSRLETYEAFYEGLGGKSGLHGTASHADEIVTSTARTVFDQLLFPMLGRSYDALAEVESRSESEDVLIEPKRAEDEDSRVEAMLEQIMEPIGSS